MSIGFYSVFIAAVRRYTRCLMGRTSEVSQSAGFKERYPLSGLRGGRFVKQSCKALVNFLTTGDKHDI
jgi:hypothetical protein